MHDATERAASASPELPPAPAAPSLFLAYRLRATAPGGTGLDRCAAALRARTFARPAMLLRCPQQHERARERDDGDEEAKCVEGRARRGSKRTSRKTLPSPSSSLPPSLSLSPSLFLPLSLHLSLSLSVNHHAVVVRMGGGAGGSSGIGRRCSHGLPPPAPPRRHGTPPHPRHRASRQPARRCPHVRLHTRPSPHAPIPGPALAMPRAQQP